MPDLPGYESQLSREAVAFVVSLPKGKQRLVLALADQIARQPFAIGDYRTTDAAGRPIENLLLDGFLFTYWIDHASREVRITEVVQV